MMGQHSPANCCCGSTPCEDCCSGNDPTEFDATITMADDACDTCDSFVSGTYTLALDGVCIWRYVDADISGQACVTGDPEGDDYITEVAVTLQISCVSDTEYRVTLQVSVVREYTDGSEVQYGFPLQTRNFFGVDVYKYQATVAVDDFTCNAVTDYELPLVSKTATRTFEFWNFVSWSLVGLNPTADATTWMGWDIDYHCNPASTATITAVP